LWKLELFPDSGQKFLNIRLRTKDWNQIIL
jgi:hypothetical protein